MSKFWKHLKTVVRHRWYVCKLCCHCGIVWQGLVHDLSKFSFAEFLPAIKYANGKQSPHEGEIKDHGYSAAWLHHKGRNKHHFEYWLDPIHSSTPCRMPAKYMVEMICDRVGAGMAYGGKSFQNDAPLKYLRSKAAKERPLMHPATYRTLEHALVLLADNGIDSLVAFCKHLLKGENE